MAEIQSSEKRNKKGVRRSKKLSTRVDLTPMVDLGFLLITFFIFTTTMAEAKSMKLALPSDEQVKDPINIAESKTISLLLGDDNTVYYYDGLNITGMKSTNYAGTGIRAVLQKKIQLVDARFNRKGETIVLIKPTIYASYQNLIDILDEMLINGLTRYVLMDISAEEVKQLPTKGLVHH